MNLLIFQNRELSLTAGTSSISRLRGRGKGEGGRGKREGAVERDPGGKGRAGSLVYLFVCLFGGGGEGV